MDNLMDKNLHPFLLAVYPILFLYSHNIEQVPLSATFIPLILALFFVSLLYLILRKLALDSRNVAIVSSAFIILFFSFDIAMGFLEYLQDYMGYEMRAGFILAVYIVFFYSLSHKVLGMKRDLIDVTKALNFTSIILVAFSLSNIGLYALQTSDAKLEESAHIFTSGEGNVSDLPDIYYIILDEYGREDTLNDVFGFNNSVFINKLEDKGFYIASKSRTNYGITYVSIASTLNLEYMDYLEDNPGKDSNDRSIPYQMVKNNKVAEYLKSKGYLYINIKSTWGPTDDMGAELELGYSPYGENTEYYNVLIQTTSLQPFQDIIIGRDLRKSRLYAFEKLKEIPEIDAPTFTFIHIMLPHSPYIFDREGNTPPHIIWDMEHHGMDEEYISQLIYTNNRILEVVDEVIASSEKKPIIILQSDHGTRSKDHHRADNIHNLSKELLDERMAIFNAYYLPDSGTELLYESITPVNTFRIIFNYYFNENYTLLEDRSYFSNVYYPYDFIFIPPEEIKQ